MPVILTLPSGESQYPVADPFSYFDQAPAQIATPLGAVNLERDVSGAVAFHRRRALFQGISNVATSVNSSTWTALPLTEEIDTFGGHNDLSLPARVFTPGFLDSGAWYLCTGYVPFTNSSAGKSHVAGIRINAGGTVWEGAKLPGGTGHAADMLVCDLLLVNNDTPIELMGYQDTGAALLISTASKTPSLTIRWACAPSGDVVASPGLPRTWTATDLLTGDATGTVGPYTKVPLNVHIRDVLRFLRYPPAARIWAQATGQSIPSGAWTSFQFDAEHLDNYGGHNPASNNTRYTCQRAGLYFVYGLAAMAEAASGNVGYRASRLLVNGSTAYAGTATVPATSSSLGTALPATAMIRLGVGDFVELQAFQTQGSNLAVKGGAGDHARLICVWQSL